MNAQRHSNATRQTRLVASDLETPWGTLSAQGQTLFRALDLDSRVTHQRHGKTHVLLPDGSEQSAALYELPELRRHILCLSCVFHIR